MTLIFLNLWGFAKQFLFRSLCHLHVELFQSGSVHYMNKIYVFLYSNTNKMNYLNLWYIYFCYGLLEVYYIHFHASPIFEEVTHHCEKNIDVRISSTRFKTWLQPINSLCRKKTYFNSYHLFNFLFFFSFFISVFIYLLFFISLFFKLQFSWL